jgi:hypothetical protein
MNRTQNRYGTMPFGHGIFAVIAQALSGEPNPARRALVLATANATGAMPARSASAPKTSPARPGLLGRIGERLWHRQLSSVQSQVARSDSLFESLDRWLWKQHVRDTEAWLAQSHDVFELERRIRQLERNRDGCVF